MTRRAKPIEQKRLTGRSRTQDVAGRALPEPIVTFDVTLKPPPTPRGLGETGREVWQQMWTAGAAWLAPQTDRYVLHRICRLHEQIDAMYAQIDTDGLMLGAYAHPLLTKLRTAELELTKLEGLCGFNPVARGQLGYAEVKRVSKIDELIDRRTARKRSA